MTLVYSLYDYKKNPLIGQLCPASVYVSANLNGPYAHEWGFQEWEETPKKLEEVFEYLLEWERRANERSIEEVWVEAKIWADF